MVPNGMRGWRARRGAELWSLRGGSGKRGVGRGIDLKPHCSDSPGFVSVTEMSAHGSAVDLT